MTGGPPLIDGGRCLAAGMHTVVNQDSDGYIISGSARERADHAVPRKHVHVRHHAPFHPFYIRQEGAEYNKGVTGNHTSMGNLVFAVPATRRRCSITSARPRLDDGAD